MNTQEKKQSLKAQSIWLLMAKVVGFGLSFMLPLLIVRNLTQTEVGHYREAFQVIANAVIILPVGFSMSAYYFLARDRERRPAAIFNILLFNFVVGGLACLVLFLFPQLIGNIFRSPELTQLAPYIGVVIWIWIFSTFLETVAIANQEAKTATLFIILAQLTKTLLMGGAVLIFATVESFIYAAMIQGVIQTFVLFVYLRSRFPGFWRSFDLEFFWEQMRYAVPFGVAGILWMAQMDIHNYFAGHRFSSAEFAIYAYGCFEVPLIAMLSESVTSVLIPRMNELHQQGKQEEMVSLTIRAMQKLSFFYFPIYVFLLITAQTFIITLFTKNFEASAAVFVINITLLPFSILITDPMIRSFKELGRKFLIARVLILASVVGIYFTFLPQLGMTQIIGIAVAAIILEKFVAEAMVISKLRIRLSQLTQLKVIAKTAIAAAIAGVVTYFAYWEVKDYLLSAGEHFASDVLHSNQLGVLNFVGGAFVLSISGLVYGSVYISTALLMGLIEDEEKDMVRRVVSKFIPSLKTTKNASEGGRP
ncbi:MAG: oligosaccharide flippase family protein [Blastocatellia bacterium]|nr:oligosaccharide flippase family protein [Blastocatellia bacterium]